MAVETSREPIRPVTGTHVVRVQHEGIATADAERSKDFYCRVLGFQVLPRPAFTSGGYWLGTPGIFPQIHIIQSQMQPPGSSAPISPLGRHTCFEVADYEAMKATLEREGIKYVENTQPGGATIRTATRSSSSPRPSERAADAGPASSRHPSEA